MTTTSASSAAPPRLFDRTTGARYLDPSGQIITARTLRRADEAGELPALKVAGRHCYTPEALDAWLASRAVSR
jgi:hypothetical protein